MNIIIPKEIIKEIRDSGVDSEFLERDYSEVKVDHGVFKSIDIQLIASVARKHANRASGDKWQRDCDLLLRRLDEIKSTSSKGKKFKRLEPLAEAMRRLIETLPHRWVFVDDDTSGEPNAFLVTEVTFHERTGRHPAYIAFESRALVRGKEVQHNRSLYNSSITNGATAEESLARCGAIPETPELVKRYEENFAKWEKFCNRSGIKMRLRDSGIVESDDEERWWRKNDKTVIEQPGETAFGILDDDERFGDAPRSHIQFSLNAKVQDQIDLEDEVSDEKTTAFVIPTIPHLRLFSLTLHEFIVTHVVNADAHVYSDISDKLVLPAGTHKMIDLLMNSNDNTDDIIENKGKGVIVLASGIPGCLRGDTPIHDPVDGSTMTVRERHDRGLAFNVVAMDKDGKHVVARGKTVEISEGKNAYIPVFNRR